MSDTGQEAESRNEGNMSIFEHLNELRFRLTRSAYIIFLGAIACWGFSERIFDFLREPIAPFLPSGGLIFTAPMDKFMAHMKISLIGGLLITTPFWLYQLWCFISPALYKREKKLAIGFVFFGTLQFVMGLAFSYYFVLPLSFKFLMNFGGTTDQAMITIDSYFSFLTHAAIVFGICFEMPVIISFLGLMGVVSRRFLIEKWRYSVLIMSLISAVAAPPDALSMILMIGALAILYVISIVVVGYFEKVRIEKAQNEA